MKSRAAVGSLKREVTTPEDYELDRLTMIPSNIVRSGFVLAAIGGAAAAGVIGSMILHWWLSV